MYSKRHITGIVLLLAIIALVVIFAGPPKPPERPEGNGMPQEFIKPCIGKDEGDNCTIEDFRGTEESRCEYMEDMLVCFPHRMPPQK